MSGFQTNLAEGGIGFADLSVVSAVTSDLIDLLMAEAIVPGRPPSYQLCKKIYTSHPLGAKIAENPIAIAQSQPRMLSIPGGPEQRLKEAFEREWRNFGGPGVSADTIIRQLHTTKRIYGIASLAVGSRGKAKDTAKPLDTTDFGDLFFNIADPLNTAGALVLDQDPNSAYFQRPSRALWVAGQLYHPSRLFVVMNEQPIYIEFTESAFGFVGRSVYQRALFPLKTFVQTMITDDFVAKKVGLLIANVDSPGSTITSRMLGMFGLKAQRLKTGITGNVLMIGKEDKVESLNFQNLQGAGEFARTNCLKNIGAAVPMPAIMLDEETMARGMAEGTEDAKRIAKYIAGVREEMNPTYALCDGICQRRAWSQEFYNGVAADFSQYQSIPYETAFYQWRNSFQSKWPNLLEEPESEKVKVAEVKFKSVVALIEVLSPLMDPDNKAQLLGWAADEVNQQRDLFSGVLLLDEQKLAEFGATKEAQAALAAQPKEPEPAPFSGRT